MSSSLRSRFMLRAAALALVPVVPLPVAAAAYAEDDRGPPPSADPRDISGVWYGTGFFAPEHKYFRPMEGGDPPFLPAALAKFTKRRDAEAAGNPELNPRSACTPHGVPAVMQAVAPFQIIQTPGQISMVFETDHQVRIIPLDKDHPKNVKRTYMGDSVAHWEGDTLVIDTVGLHGEMWLDFGGTPASDKLHVIERYKKISGGRVLEALITIDDLGTYTKPWTARRTFLWRPLERVGEEICEENNERIEPGAQDRTPLGH